MRSTCLNSRDDAACDCGGLYIEPDTAVHMNLIHGGAVHRRGVLHNPFKFHAVFCYSLSSDPQQSNNLSCLRLFLHLCHHGDISTMCTYAMGAASPHIVPSCLCCPTALGWTVQRTANGVIWFYDVVLSWNILHSWFSLCVSTIQHSYLRRKCQRTSQSSRWLVLLMYFHVRTHVDFNTVTINHNEPAVTAASAHAPAFKKRNLPKRAPSVWQICVSVSSRCL